MPTLKIHPSVRGDILEMGKESPKARNKAVGLLNALRESEELRDALFSPGDKPYPGAGKLNVSPWVEQQRAGRDLWRMKAVRDVELNDAIPILSGYRVIFKTELNPRSITILAIVRRSDFNYENGNTELSSRILKDYDDEL